MNRSKFILLTASLLLFLFCESYGRSKRNLDEISEETKIYSEALDSETQSLRNAEDALTSANDEIVSLNENRKTLRWYHFFRKRKLNQKKIEAEKRFALTKEKKKQSLQKIDDLDKRIEDIKNEIDRRKEESKTLKGKQRAEENKQIAELHKEIASIHQRMAKLRPVYLEKNKVKKVAVEKKVKIKKEKASGEKQITIEKTKKVIVNPKTKKVKNKRGGSTNY